MTTTMDVFVLFYKASSDCSSSLNQQLNFPFGKRKKCLQISSRDTTSELQQGPDGAPAAESTCARTSLEEGVVANLTRTSMTAPLEKERNNWMCFQLLFLRKPDCASTGTKAGGATSKLHLTAEESFSPA